MRWVLLHPSLRRLASSSTQPPCRNRGTVSTPDSVGSEHRARPADPSPWSHATPAQPDGADGPKAAGPGHPHRGVTLADFPDARRVDRGVRPPWRRSPGPAVSQLGIVPSRARPLWNFSSLTLPHVDPVAARSTAAALHAIFPASGPRSSGQRRHGGTSFFTGSFSLSLAAPPAAPPLRRRGRLGPP
jgi:hypothetical protein